MRIKNTTQPSINLSERSRKRNKKKKRVLINRVNHAAQTFVFRGLHNASSPLTSTFVHDGRSELPAFFSPFTDQFIEDVSFRPIIQLNAHTANSLLASLLEKEASVEHRRSAAHVSARVAQSSPDTPPG